MKSALYVEYQEKQILEKDLVAKAKAAWKSMGNKATDLKSLHVYCKPEDNMAYCVFNDDITAEFALD